ncbi:MAG TPA: polyprenyl synthetase family protein [Actinomycetota bacterium]|nr:polyprenyl synthetase family protein [Actinomycetota bacterium]
MPAAAQALERLQDYLAACAERIDAEIALVLETEVEDPWLRGAISYHFGWAGPDFVPLPAGERPAGRAAGGKRLRPALVLLTYQGAVGEGGTGPADDHALAFATALELIHNYSLIHDDIQDRDLLRRGRPTVWSICGQAQAINVGNCLHAAGYAACLGRFEAAAGTPLDTTLLGDLIASLATASMRMTWGQRRDLTFETTDDVTVDMYLQMVQGKTAALISCATYGGALLAFNGTRAQAPVDAYAEFGRQLGMGFQIRDDILGIWGSESQTGKPSGGDIRRRKKSLPVLLALQEAAPAARSRLRDLYAQTAHLTSDEESDVRTILDECRARALAEEHAHQHGQRALAALTEAAGRPEALRENSFLSTLEQLTSFATTAG